MQRRFVSGSILSLVGYILSPLSWWNDALVNIPLAYACAWLLSFIYKPVFGPAFVAGYWVTNIVGLIMMHKGICKMVQADYCEPANRRKRLIYDLLISAGYTALIVLLLKFNIIRPLDAYFK